MNISLCARAEQCSLSDDRRHPQIRGYRMLRPRTSIIRLGLSALLGFSALILQACISERI